jgi:hypothetical protein
MNNTFVKVPNLGRKTIATGVELYEKCKNGGLMSFWR